MKGGGGGAVLLAMQVSEIPAGGRGFPLVLYNAQNLRYNETAVNVKKNLYKTLELGMICQCPLLTL